MNNITNEYDKVLTEKSLDSSQASDCSLSVYIPMPDGVKIAIDIWLPVDYIPGIKVPTAVSFTRYWRAAENHLPSSRITPLVHSGVAIAIVDCRGTGASFGYREVEFSGTEATDFASVIQWLSIQPWSNGSVVSIGVSYCANTAELALFNAPSALKAAIPLFSDFDLYANISFPGGLLNSGFLIPWSEGVKAMDLNETATINPVWEDYRHKRIKPVANDNNKNLLVQALQQHKQNVSIEEFLATVKYRDDYNLANNFDDSHRAVSPHLLQNNQHLREAPSYHWASFTDAGTAAGAIARFVGSTAPMRVVIGYWSHGAEFGTSPFRDMGHDPSPSVEKQWSHIADYIHAICDNEQQSIQSKLSLERVLYYYTAGEERWKKTQVWPPAGINAQRWFLNEHHTLSLELPTGNSISDTYHVDFDAGTGAYPRWDQITKEVHYGDRAEPDKKCLTYTSTPLRQTVEITGHPVVMLQLSSTRTDGAIIIYLESVAPDGTVTMLTEGGLRLIHRKVSTKKPPYPHWGPYHTFEKSQALPMPVGQRVEVGFECLPLSVQIQKGHALRVAIAGHDKDCFDRLPKTGDVTLTLFHHPQALSFIELPIRYLNDQLRNNNNEPVSPFHV